jgi:hypothetical protein
MNAKLFWANHTVSKNGCWEWDGAKQEKGYGRVFFNGEYFYAHRLAWILTNGPIPDGFYICHHCDNTSCINPAHLFVGTSYDNAMDRESKNRNKGNKKLSENDVILARQLYNRGLATIKDLSRCLHVGYADIRNIVSGASWKRLPIRPEWNPLRQAARDVTRLD